AADVGIEGAVARLDVEVPGVVGCRRTATLPYAAEPTVGSGHVSGDGAEVGRRVAEDPAVVRADVAMRRRADVDDAVHEREGRALMLPQGMVRDHAAATAIAGAGYGRR